MRGALGVLLLCFWLIVCAIFLVDCVCCWCGGVLLQPKVHRVRGPAMFFTYFYFFCCVACVLGSDAGSHYRRERAVSCYSAASSWALAHLPP